MGEFENGWIWVDIFVGGWVERAWVVVSEAVWIVFE